MCCNRSQWQITVCTGQPISCYKKLHDTLEGQIASCELGNFVAAASCTNSVWFDFVRLVAATKFCCWDNDFHITSPEHMICCCNVLPEWVAATWHLVSSDLYCYLVVLVFIIYILSCYDVNFLTQMSSSQSEEQTMSFTHEKRHKKNYYGWD